MRVLIDTHVLLWMIGDPGRLSGTAADALGDPASELLVSAVTPWEMATEHRIGELPRAKPILDPFDRLLAAQAVLESVLLVTRDPVLTCVPGVRVL